MPVPIPALGAAALAAGSAVVAARLVARSARVQVDGEGHAYVLGRAEVDGQAIGHPLARLTLVHDGLELARWGLRGWRPLVRAHRDEIDVAGPSDGAGDWCFTSGAGTFSFATNPPQVLDSLLASTGIAAPAG